MENNRCRRFNHHAASNPGNHPHVDHQDIISTTGFVTPALETMGEHVRRMCISELTGIIQLKMMAL
ncbi:MAG: hypothetical protein JXO50_05475 [Deltaproteobacteria bacterium]|nr:hypothetical protein [Candidatus Anaeroferrophillus wilburensis]